MGYNSPLEYLNAKLEEEKTLIVDTLVQGKLTESEYKRLCGALQGLDLARNHIKDLVKKLEQLDE